MLFGHGLLKSYQRWMGIPETDVLDQATLDSISHRCANMDQTFAVVGWSPQRFINGRLDLNYWISPDFAFAPRADIEKATAEVLSSWEEGIPVKFQHVEQQQHSDLSIILGQSYSPYNCGQINALAHAKFPVPHLPYMRCWIAFDPNRNWTLDQTQVTCWTAVLAHEIGHILGLQHTRGAGLMNPARKLEHPSRPGEEEFTAFKTKYRGCLE